MPIARVALLVASSLLTREVAGAANDPVAIHFAGQACELVIHADGRSLGNRDGSDPQLSWVKFRWDDAARTLLVEVDERMRAWLCGTRTFAVEATDADVPFTRIESANASRSNCSRATSRHNPPIAFVGKPRLASHNSQHGRRRPWTWAFLNALCAFCLVFWRRGYAPNNGCHVLGNGRLVKGSEIPIMVFSRSCSPVPPT
jgi:hypothetical protein